MITSKERKHIISKAADMSIEYKPTTRIRLKAYCDGYFSCKPVGSEEIDDLVEVALTTVEAVLEELRNE